MRDEQKAIAGGASVHCESSRVGRRNVAFDAAQVTAMCHSSSVIAHRLSAVQVPGHDVLAPET